MQHASFTFGTASGLILASIVVTPGSPAVPVLGGLLLLFLIGEMLVQSKVSAA